jgi:hypothetical protein
MSSQVPLGEYPRPQFVRSRWTNLNGLWDYAIESADRSAAPKWRGKIRVPFAVESALSGIEPSPVIGGGDVLWYRRTFAAPKLSAGERLLLHFGAVDWEARVWFNGVELGQHQGGYDAFSFDVTDELHRNGDQEVVVRVWDPTDAGYQPRGKQVSDPRGIWYTAVTGIWQTVWLEPVPALSLATLAITPDAAHGRLRLLPTLRGGGKRVQPGRGRCTSRCRRRGSWCRRAGRSDRDRARRASRVVAGSSVPVPGGGAPAAG